ncbi:unnamed protein product [Leuciscus chuanchicus]
MAFIKEEIEDVKIEETFSVKQEDPEEQTDLMAIKEETERQPFGGHVPVDVYYFTVVYRNVFLNSQEEEIRKPLFGV